MTSRVLEGSVSSVGREQLRAVGGDARYVGETVQVRLRGCRLDEPIDAVGHLGVHRADRGIEVPAGGRAPDIDEQPVGGRLDVGDLRSDVREAVNQLRGSAERILRRIPRQREHGEGDQVRLHTRADGGELDGPGLRARLVERVSERRRLGRYLLRRAVEDRAGPGHLPVTGECLGEFRQEVGLLGGRLDLAWERELARTGVLRSSAVAAGLRARGQINPARQAVRVYAGTVGCGGVEQIPLDAVRIREKTLRRRARRLIDPVRV